MRTPTDADLLALWQGEAGPAHPLRASAVLAQVCDDDVAAMRAGEADAALLRWYARTAGPELDATALCPECGQDVGVAVRVDDVLVAPGPGSGVLALDGYTVRFHAPTLGELERVATSGPADPAAAAEAVLRGCVEECRSAGTDVDPAVLPPAVRDALDAAIADADPGAELALVLECPACAHRWTDVLDPLGFVRQAVRWRVAAIVEQVHVLASAYGWSESEILALPPARRRLYLDVIGA
jgi:hypothetical protein